MRDQKPVSIYDRVRDQLEADAWEIMLEQVGEGNIASIEVAQVKFQQWRVAWMSGVMVDELPVIG